MAITHRIVAAPSKKAYMSWAEMQKTMSNVMMELRANGLKFAPEYDFLKAPSYVRRGYYSTKVTAKEVQEVLRRRGFRMDNRFAVLYKKIGSKSVEISFEERGPTLHMELTVSDNNGPEDQDVVGPGHSHYD
jgi:hypothetical protein